MAKLIDRNSGNGVFNPLFTAFWETNPTGMKLLVKLSQTRTFFHFLHGWGCFLPLGRGIQLPLVTSQRADSPVPAGIFFQVQRDAEAKDGIFISGLVADANRDAALLENMGSFLNFAQQGTFKYFNARQRPCGRVSGLRALKSGATWV